MSPATVAISIVTWNSASEISECLQGLAELPENWQVWVVDNNSADDTVELIKKEFPFVKVIANKDNKGFASANNQVVEATSTDYVLFLNPDTKATSEKLIKSLEIIEAKLNVGILAVQLSNEDGSLQTNCFHFPKFWKNAIDAFGLYRLFRKEKITEFFAGEFFSHNTSRKVDWVKGAFMLTRRKAINIAGAIPEDYFMFAEDLDFCWQITKTGFDVWFDPEVSIVHKSNKSAGQLASVWRVRRTTLSKYLFCLKNFGFFKGRLIQLTDLIGVNYKIIRRRLRPQQNNEIEEWKLGRREILKSVFMRRKDIIAKLQER